MFNENPFAGACPYATYEVLAMLLGTLTLGVLLGYLIWGWLRKRVTILENSVDKHKRIANLRESQIVNLKTQLQTLTEDLERAETKVSLSEFKMRTAQDEVETIQAKLDQLEQEPPMAQVEKSDSDTIEPTLADISQIMETGSLSTPAQGSSDEKAAVRPAPLVKGVTNESLEMARQIFNVPVKANDLMMIRGIDQKMEEILHRAGVRSWSELAATRLPALRRIVEDAGPRYRTYDPKTWAMQARMATKGEWKKLKNYQDSLIGE